MKINGTNTGDDCSIEVVDWKPTEKDEGSLECDFCKQEISPLLMIFGENEGGFNCTKVYVCRDCILPLIHELD